MWHALRLPISTVATHPTAILSIMSTLERRYGALVKNLPAQPVIAWDKHAATEMETTTLSRARIGFTVEW
ncbi:unnamed protein product [Clonostachys byssicola]|uniref:Uncharacterized protein n=1 Tax=Clonostachys byssicola TaxID=160290 RepID=A0A9N9UC86_9HYPO|nr:unnamed protein product [Clonostachys byssicola]